RPETLQADVRAARAMDLTAHAAALDVPTLVLSGGRDRLTTPALAERLGALIPGSRLHIVDGAGHMLPLEAADRVNREIVAFVESLAAPLPATRPLDDRERSLSRLLDRLAGLARRLRGSPRPDCDRPPHSGFLPEHFVRPLTPSRNPGSAARRRIVRWRPRIKRGRRQRVTCGSFDWHCGGPTPSW